MPFTPCRDGILQSFAQSQMIERGRPELADDTVHYIVDMRSDGHDSQRIGVNIRLTLLCTIGYRSSNGLDRRNALSKFVVQFPRNASAFFLQTALYCARQLAILLQLELGLPCQFVLRDIAHAADFADDFIAPGVDQWRRR